MTLVLSQVTNTWSVSTEESHGIEIITQEIKGLDDEKGRNPEISHLERAGSYYYP